MSAEDRERIGDEERDRRARLRAQIDQLSAEGRGLTEDPRVVEATIDYGEATVRLVRALEAAGLPRDAWLGAVLAPTAEMVIGMREGTWP